MDEQRFQAYTKLIRELLAVSSQEELQEILQQQRDLIDEGFFAVGQNYAEQFESEGEEETAAFLVNLFEYIAREKRQEAYLQVIQALMQCAEGEESQILAANEHLVDGGLVQTIELVATDLDRQQEGSGDSLRNLGQYITQYIEATKLTEVDIDFLYTILRTTGNGGEKEKEQVYALLRQNPDKISPRMAMALQTLANNVLPTLETEQRNEIGHLIWNFVLFLQEFPLGNKSNNTEIVITGYRIILNIFTKSKFSNEWATIQNNLGIAYRNRIRGDWAKNIDSAIECFQNALTVHTKTEFFQEWAGIQNNLAVAYINRIKGDRAENIERAIECCRNALKIFTQNNFPYQWAGIQINLSYICIERTKGDYVENIEQAIECCRNALKIFTQNNFPYQWAETKNSLGIAYFKRIKEKRAKNIDLAIECFQSALTVRNRQNFPHEWGITQNNLGLAYTEQINENQEKNLERAIECFQSALTVRNRQNFPHEWAMTQNNLGVAFSNLLEGNQENLEQAIECFQNTLIIYTQQNFPYEWAMTQNNLGNAYVDKTVGNERENIEKAVEYYQNALIVYTPQNSSAECSRTANYLGNLYFKEENWESAVHTYTTAIEAIENIRLKSLSDDRRQEIMDEAITVYMNMVQACVKLGQLQTAIEYAERSRCRRLVDLMESNRIYNDDNIPQEVAEYLKKYRSIQQQIDTESQRLQNDGSQSKLAISGAARGNRDSYEATIEAIARLETEKQQVWQQIRSFDKVLSEQIQVEHISFDRIRQLIPDDSTALIYCYTTSTKLQIFVVFKDRPVQLHPTDLNPQQLKEFGSDSWFNPYLYWRGKLNEEQIQKFIKDKDPPAWREKMPETLAQLAGHLKLSTLVQNYLEGIEELIIIPHLYLHSIPFSALPIELSSYKFLGERFRLRILPSAQTLQFCHRREKISWNNQGDKFGTVEDADNTLPFSQYEGKQISQMYLIPVENRLRGKEKATVDNYRQLIKKVNVQVLHSSHHASSRLDSPLESQLQLADGNISLGEIMSPGWRIPHLTDVFLSCCETNLGVSQLSDEPLTLATGFLCAGARSVVSTLWAVDDLATAIFSIIYYRLRKDGLDRPIALQQAQHELKHISGEESEDHYPELHEYIDTQFKQANNNRKEAKARLKQLSEGTPEYERVEAEASQWNQIATKFSRSKKRLKEFQPFAHPYYWAGFVSQGLR